MTVLAVTWGALLEVIWISLLGGVAISAIFSFAVFGGTRAVEARRGGRTMLAAAYAALLVCALAIFAIGVAVGVQVMLSKS